MSDFKIHTGSQTKKVLPFRCLEASRRVRNRLMFNQFVRALSSWSLRILGVFFILVIVTKLLSVGDSFWWGGGLIALGLSVLCAFVYLLKHPMQLDQAAGLIDQELGTKSLVRSAIDFYSGDEIQFDNEHFQRGFVALAVEDAEDLVEGMSVDTVAGKVPFSKLWGGGVFVALTIVVGIWMPARAVESRNEELVVAQGPLNSLDSTLQGLQDAQQSEGQSDLIQDEIQEAIHQIEDLKDELAMGSETEETAQAEAASKLETIAKELEDKAESIRAEEQQVLDQVSQDLNPKDLDADPYGDQIDEHSLPDGFDELIESLMNQEYEQASDQLDQLEDEIGQLQEQDREKLLKNLEELAESIEENRSKDDSRVDEPNSSTSDQSEQSESVGDQDSNHSTENTDSSSDSRSGSQSETDEQSENQNEQGETRAQEQESSSQEGADSQKESSEIQEDTDSHEHLVDPNAEQSEDPQSGQSREDSAEQQPSENPSSEQREENGAPRDQDRSSQHDSSQTERLREQIDRLQEQQDQRKQLEELADQLREDVDELKQQRRGNQGQNQDNMATGSDGLDKLTENQDQSAIDDELSSPSQFDNPEVPQGEDFDDRGRQQSVSSDGREMDSQNQSSPSRAATEDSQDVESSAWDRAQRAIEDREVPRKYHRLVREAFDRARERAQEKGNSSVAPQGKDAEPASSSNKKQESD